jgi:hypothetical protein
LNVAVPQDSLSGFGSTLCFVHQPIAQAVTQIVKPEPLAIHDVNASFLCRRCLRGCSLTKVALRAAENRREVPLNERKAKKGKNLTGIFWVAPHCGASSWGGQTVDYEKIATAAAEGMTVADLHRFLAVCALVSDMYCPGYNSQQSLAKDSNLANAATRYKVDAAKITQPFEPN